MKNNDWTPCKAELFAEKWWKEHGFGVKLKSRFITKSDYIISKDGVSFIYPIIHSIKDFKAMMAHFEEFYDLFIKTSGGNV